MSAQRPEYHIITKVFKGHATRSDRDQVARWVRSDEHNRIEYQKLKMIWGAYGIHHDKKYKGVKCFRIDRMKSTKGLNALELT